MRVIFFDIYADNFKSIYKLNSVSRNKKLKTKFIRKFDIYVNNHISDECFSVEKLLNILCLSEDGNQLVDTH